MTLKCQLWKDKISIISWQCFLIIAAKFEKKICEVRTSTYGRGAYLLTIILQILTDGDDVYLLSTLQAECKLSVKNVLGQFLNGKIQVKTTTTTTNIQNYCLGCT